MKSYLFTTEDDRGGVILCDIDTMEEVVPYLQQRFKGVVRVEQGRSEWTSEGGFAEFTPVPVTQPLVDGNTNSTPQGETGKTSASVEPEADAKPESEVSLAAPAEDTMTGSLF